MSDEPARRMLSLPSRGVELCVFDWGGSGPPALLTHANGFCAAVLEPVANELRGKYRVFGFDSRGHGASSKPEPPGPYAWGEFAEDLIAVAESLCATLACERVAYTIGHSFGGTATLTAAARRPELFARIGLLDPVVTPPSGEHATWYPDRQPGGNPMAALTRRRREVFASRAEARGSWARRALFSDWDPRAFELYLRYGLHERADGRVELSCPREVEAAVFDAGGGFDLFRELDGLRAPGLLLHARRGNFPRALIERLVASAPTLVLDEIDSGHLFPLIVPQQVAQRLLEFAAAP